MKSETLMYIIEGLCHVSATLKQWDNNNGGRFRDPTAWDDGMEYYLIWVDQSTNRPLILPVSFWRGILQGIPGYWWPE